MDLSGKTAFITGGAGAIGSAMCREFVKCGAGVAIADITEEKGLALEKELIDDGMQACFVYTDITDIKSVEAAVATVMKKFGKIDILINNAGYNTHLSKRAIISDQLDEEWEKGIDINLNGVFHCSKAIIKHMVDNKYGRIINISSILGQVPLRTQAPYSTAKAAIINLTKAMAMELADFNILVNCISPGSISHVSIDSADFFYGDKDKSRKLLEHIPMHRPGKPVEIARVAAFLASEEISYMTGSNIMVDGGWICGDMYAEMF